MKKIFLTIMIVLMMGIIGNAQHDSFFNGNQESDSRASNNMPLIPAGAVGTLTDDVNANSPIGSGLLILTALGAGYALRKKLDKKE